MDDRLREVLIAQVTKAVEGVLVASRGKYETHLVYQRPHDGQLHMRYEPRPFYGDGMAALRNNVLELVGQVEGPWSVCYPEFRNGDVFACSDAGGGCRLRPQDIIEHLVQCALSNQSRGVPVEVAIQGAVSQFERELTERKVRILFVAPIAGLHIVDPSIVEIPLDAHVSIVRLSDAEFQRLYGGPIAMASLRDRAPDSGFAFRGEFDATLRLSSDKKNHSHESDAQRIVDNLRKLQRGLLVFKGGCLDYRRIWFSALRPSVFVIGNFGSIFPDRWPASSYKIGPADLEPLKSHLKRMDAVGAISQIDNACSRLCDAELRENAVDSLSDAVIGLESLLAGDGEREGLRLKFAMNYASLAAYSRPEERLRRFREASELYLIRSKVFHGSEDGAKEYEFVDGRLPLGEIAGRSREMLRETIKTFMAMDVPKKNAKDFWKKYWPHRYFGIGEACAPPDEAKTVTTD